MLKRDELTDPTSCLNKARNDERLFVLLGRDPCAPLAIMMWVEARILMGKNRRDDPQVVEALECARLMREERLARAAPTPEDRS